MTLKQLRTFLAVAQSLSFTQACLHLHISQPALSLAIKNLEASLGGALLSRTTRSVTLTPEGEILLPIAQRLLTEWENTEELLRQHFTLQLGRVAIAAMPSFAANRLPQAIKAFRDHHPNINVTVHDVINEKVVEMVLDRRVELGVVFEPDTLDSLKFIPIYLDRFVAVVPPTSDLITRNEIRWPELSNQPFIALQRPSAVRRVIEMQVGQLQAAFESHQFTTIGRMVEQGLGVSVVPSICTQQMRELGAYCIPMINPKVERHIGLIKRVDVELSAAAHALVETIRSIAIRT
ncbi:LysR family transcriptional regulator near succinyl-CoA:3-ketoacid-coenzyme A transferase [Pseudomonas sp. 9AZ]|uniref:LysR family transcriptional regulator n=1 Tax=Pseudomonas sp. 9AZ TaxID=2653168 RepID=UPI0012F1E00E|nr:LysR family transcriptional regulator [Pseudomonas sp. 9AZ]VXC77888.1 LysR family transcriptional regulator near succinyl-CoA:3-ketoacid-coenzyme A transferase [Pseudomonas sp. 9AZ]